MRLGEYKMTDDTGFAPNPFWGFMTLATCKPQIRKCKHPGDWIAGFTSGELCDDPVGGERLVFGMEIGEKIALANYVRDGRLRSKIPRRAAANICAEGDNIYRPLIPNARNPAHFEQLRNRNHGPQDQAHDVSGQYALIAKRFAYFGVEAIPLPRHVRPDVPAAQAGHGAQTHDVTRAKRFIDYVFGLPSAAVMHRPHQWPSTDSSWKTDGVDVPDPDHPGIEGKSPKRPERGWPSLGTGSARSPSSRKAPPVAPPANLTGCGRRRR